MSSQFGPTGDTPLLGFRLEITLIGAAASSITVFIKKRLPSMEITYWRSSDGPPLRQYGIDVPVLVAHAQPYAWKPCTASYAAACCVVLHHTRDKDLPHVACRGTD
jgi:hypothetical protein